MRFFILISITFSLFADEFSDKLLTNVRASVEYSIPQKEEILALLNQLEKDGKVLETGNDDLRIKFVNAQGSIEHTLACFQALGEIEELVGVIHTPMPATPLCVKPDDVKEILDASIRENTSKMLTVHSRAQIVREYLMKGGTLYIVYPKGGLELRSAAQQAIYREELSQYPDHLIDWPLNADQIDPDMIGATYLFKNKESKAFAFSIKSRQVNDIQTQAEWGLWFGPLEGAVADRVNTMLNDLVSLGGPEI